MYFAVVAKEFITSSCGDGLPFQLEWLNQAGTARAIRWESKGQSGHQSQSSCKTSTIVLLREKMFCWCPASTGQGREELGMYVVSRHPFWLYLKFFSLSLVLLIQAFGAPLSSQVQRPCLDLACDTNMVLVSKQRKTQGWIKQDSQCVPPGFWFRYLENKGPSMCCVLYLEVTLVCFYAHHRS